MLQAAKDYKEHRHKLQALQAFLKDNLMEEVPDMVGGPDFFRDDILVLVTSGRLTS